MNEIWKDLPGYEGHYMCSDIGNVKSCDRYVSLKNKKGTEYKRFKRGRILSTNLAWEKYFTVMICLNNVQKPMFVHVLIAKAFIGNIQKGFVVNHKDGNKKNNHSSNLEIVKKSEDLKHAYRTGLRTSNSGKILKSTITDEMVEYIRSNTHILGKDLAKKFGVAETTISAVRLYRMKNYDKREPISVYKKKAK